MQKCWPCHVVTLQCALIVSWILHVNHHLEFHLKSHSCPETFPLQGCSPLHTLMHQQPVQSEFWSQVPQQCLLQLCNRSEIAFLNECFEISLFVWTSQHLTFLLLSSVNRKYWCCVPVHGQLFTIPSETELQKCTLLINLRSFCEVWGWWSGDYIFAGV